MKTWLIGPYDAVRRSCNPSVRFDAAGNCSMRVKSTGVIGGGYIDPEEVVVVIGFGAGVGAEVGAACPADLAVAAALR